ncbi:MAG: amidohydrolase [Limisphaerales bacterium]
MPDRRAFLSASALALAGVCAGCASASRAPRAPGILDTHTHFYDPTRPQGVPWPPKDDPLLHRTVLPADWREIAQPLGVTHTVVVEASPWIEDNAWILELAQNDPSLAGLVGHLKPGQPGFTDDLARFAANPRFRGIRTGGWDVRLAPDRPAFLKDLEHLADRSLTLDVLIGPNQLPAVTELAARIPHLRIVIDHCANVRVDGEEPPAAWLYGIEFAARHPNVHMKVSGLVEGTGKSDGTAPDDAVFYQPTLDALWDCFGPKRLLFGSNWPVSARFASYATTLGIVRDYFASRGASASNAYFRGNAESAYRLKPS